MSNTKPKKPAKKPATKKTASKKAPSKKAAATSKPKDLTKEWNVVWRDVNSLTPYMKNARVNDKTVPYLVNSIKRFGFKVPLVIDSEGVIVCGHTRLKAALDCGLARVPCVLADDLTPAEIKAFRLADNKIQEMSGWDFQLLDEELQGLKDVGFTDDDLKGFGFGDDNAVDPDDFFEDEGDGEKEDKEPKTVECTCPQCGHKFTQEVK